jgi:hypothetical protein
LRKIPNFRNHFLYYFKNEFTAIQRFYAWNYWPHWTGDRYIELRYIVKCTGRARKWPLWAGDHYTKVTATTGLTVFWQTNNTIVLTLSTGRIFHGTICLERNYIKQTCLPLRFLRKAHDFLGYLTIVVNFLTIQQICGISGKFSVLVRHFIAVPYIIDRIGISGY